MLLQPHRGRCVSRYGLEWAELFVVAKRFETAATVVAFEQVWVMPRGSL
jgi:hypothetical protein